MGLVPCIHQICNSETPTENLLGLLRATDRCRAYGCEQSWPKGCCPSSPAHPNPSARAGGAFLTSHSLQAACIPSPSWGWSAADSQREKSKKLHNSERRKEGKLRQGQTAVGFNFITCQHCFSSSFCLSFCRLLTGPTSKALLLGTLSQQTRKPLWNSLCTALSTIHLFLTIISGPPQPCKHKIYNVLWGLFSHFCCQFLWPILLLI